MNVSFLKKWAIFLALVLLSTGLLARGNWFGPDEIALDKLPVEAQQTLRLIRAGGPFPYARDGIAFGNYEKRLPVQSRGYYREYTVPTPGVQNRGARRIIAGNPQGRAPEYYYTQDHYKSFARIRE